MAEAKSSSKTWFNKMNKNLENYEYWWFHNVGWEKNTEILNDYKVIKKWLNW